MAIYVNEGYENYKYLIDVSDNYVVLTNRRTVTANYDNPKTIPVIIQYFYPSTNLIEETRTYSRSYEFDEVQISQNFFDRADSLFIINTQIYIFFLLLFFLNAFTKLVRKGGVFFGS